MNEILDEIQEEKILQKTFSRWSFVMACVSISLYLYFNSQIPSEIKASEGLPVIDPALILTLISLN